MVTSFAEAVEIGNGGTDPGWVDVPCRECGAPARFALGTVRAAVGVERADEMLRTIGALCEECEDKAKSDAYARFEIDRRARLLDLCNAPAGVPQIPLPPSLREVLHKKRRGALLFGPPGEYKTTLASVLVRQWCEIRLTRALYLTEGDLLDQLTDFAHAKDHLVRIHAAELLVLDDVGTHRETDWSAGKFFDVIDARYRSGDSLVVVANVPAAELHTLKYIDDRVMRRLSEICGRFLAVRQGQTRPASPDELVPDEVRR